jgi:hypothetical protein
MATTNHTVNSRNAAADARRWCFLIRAETKVPFVSKVSLRVRAVLADELAYVVPLVGELNPYLRHAEQHGFIVNGLESFRQAKALFGESPELVRINIWH